MTAVEWFGLTILEQGGDYVISVFEQAKEMEKQQIIDCSITTTQDVWMSAMAAFGQTLNFCNEDLEDQKQEAEQYYNETFKSE